MKTLIIVAGLMTFSTQVSGQCANPHEGYVWGHCLELPGSPAPWTPYSAKIVYVPIYIHHHYGIHRWTSPTWRRHWWDWYWN